MRKKEGLADYRYFPEPDLPGVSISNDYIENIRVSLPELPEMKRRRYEEMGLSMQDVLFLTNDVTVSLVDRSTLFAIPEPVSSFIDILSQVAEFFDKTISIGADVKLATNWIMGDISAYLKNEKLSINEIKLTPVELGELIASIKSGTISGKIGKEVKICVFFSTCLGSFVLTKL